MNPAPPVTRRRTARDNGGPYIRARRTRAEGTPNSLRTPAIRTALQDVLVIGGGGLFGQHMMREAGPRGGRGPGTFPPQQIPPPLPPHPPPPRAQPAIISPRRPPTLAPQPAGPS